jgi:nuclear pore complex protein Nup133
LCLTPLFGSGEELLLLVSYAGIEDDLVDRNAHPRRIYATVRLSVQETAPEVLAVGSVPYQSVSKMSPLLLRHLILCSPLRSQPSTSLAAVHPRLKLIPGTSVVAIQFGDAVTLCSTASNYQDRLALKTPTDRILGMGIAGVGDASVDGELLVFTSGTMMRAVLDAGKISKFDAA